MRPLEVARCFSRSIRLCLMLIAAGASLILQRPQRLMDRALWMQRWSRRILFALGITVQTIDAPLEAQAIVSNHLSYMDVLVLGANRPTLFICKQEVRHWPLIGYLVASAGSIFVDRKNPRSLLKASEEVEQAVRSGVTVAFFPEATTTDGSSLLPFQPSLYAPLVKLGIPVWCAYLSYRLALDRHAVDAVRERICYWGDMNFGRHLFLLMGLRSIEARLRYALTPLYATDRKLAAAWSYQMVRAIAISEQAPYAKGLEHLFNRPIEGIGALHHQVSMRLRR